MDYRKELKKVIKKDKRFVRLKQAFETLPEYKLPIENLFDEIKTEHKLRGVRKLNTQSSVFVDKIIETVAQDVSSRSRLTEIMMTALKANKSLRLAVTTLEAYFLDRYGNELKKVATTKTEREKFIQGMMVPYEKYIHKIDALREYANLVITDIDKANFQMRLIIDTLRIKHRPEGQL